MYKLLIARVQSTTTRRKYGADRPKSMIDRESAWCLLTEFTQSESLRKHALAVEACMRACSRKFAAGSANPEASVLGLSEEDVWGIVGPVHNFNYTKHPTLKHHPYQG